MRDQVRFKTEHFKVPLDATPNNIEITNWILSVLPTHLHADILDEDWGTSVMFHNPCFSKISLGCSHVKMNQWSIAVLVDNSIFDRLFNRQAPTKELEELICALDSAIANEPKFTDIEWFENDRHLTETNHASSAFG